MPNDLINRALTLGNQGKIFLMMDWILTKIRSVRREMRVSQEEIADRIGIDQKTYGNWETGRTELTLKNIERIAEALRVDSKIFWDPGAFPARYPLTTDKPTVVEEPVLVYNTNTLEECRQTVANLRKEVQRLTNVNLALSRSLNTLFDKKE